ncbi:FabD/lysophospholipase-like protein [Thozetella sp. PMI_491]|nr:FabD/lysophospholipase-like protein [Thozetella sp. PMI_491]
MAEAATPDAQAPPLLPRSVSSLRPPKQVPRRVPTRISIVEPKAANPREPAVASARSATSSASPDPGITSSPWSKKLILTLDGGGIRGYSSLIILRALMKEIARIEQTTEPLAQSSAATVRVAPELMSAEVLRNGLYLPCHYFDYIAGTSFGGLIAIMVGMLGMSVDDCVNEFHRQYKAIPLTNNIPGAIEFPLLHRPSTWPTKKSSSFYDTFAKFAAAATTKSAPPSATSASTPRGTPESIPNEFSKNSYQCQTLAWCTEVETRQRRPYAFCSYEEYDASERLVSIPEVAKAITTPSSSSFKPFKLGSGQFVDGSKQIRDPTLEVIKEITALLDVSGEPAIDLLLSLGTDEHTVWFYERLRKHNTRPDVSQEMGRSLRDYHRFEVPDIKLGLRKKYILREIEETTEKWLEGQTEQITKYAEMLVKRRRARAETTRWETFALGVRYFCFHEECTARDLAFDSRGEFYDHLERTHRLRKEAESDADVEEQLDKGRRFGCAEL